MPAPRLKPRVGAAAIAHRSIKRSRIHKSCVRLLTCVAAGAACWSGCRTYVPELHGAGPPAAAHPWPPHPIRVVETGETARTSCDRRTCLWQPLTRSCLRHPCVRRRRHESAPHGWCCSARITDALHAERAHGSTACAAESERVPHVQRHHPCPPSAARRSLDGAVRVGGSVGGECWRAWASSQAANIWRVLLSTHQRHSPR